MQIINYGIFNCFFTLFVVKCLCDRFIVTNLVDVGSVLVFFRFRSKSNQWLLMKVILRVTYNPMTSKPEYFNASMTLAT